MQAFKYVSIPRIFLMLKITNVFMYLLNKIHETILDLQKKAQSRWFTEKNPKPQKISKEIFG